ncbi:MAG: DNA-directed RNA polymerase sigma-70 factor [Bacteroidia bacterium]|nr:MAG: DNA-directed RNA polymerase sigma-70 factor [Bacteroidia bacterium]
MSSDKENKKENHSHLSSKARKDLELIEKAKNGNQSAFEALLKKYKNSLYASVFKIVKIKDAAEDIVFETFAKAFSRLDEYDSRFAFSTWLFRIGINKAIDYLRNKKNMSTSSIDEYMSDDSETTFADQLVSPSNDPIQEMLNEEKIAFVKFIVEKLSPRYKRVIEMFYYQEMSCEEIAKELNTTTNNVKAELFRARKVLYKIIISLKREQ